ncbi:MAG: exosortase/archaeosortase family protein, partial [Opitutaceae bacterium]
VPLIALGIAWIERKTPIRASEPDRRLGGILLGAGFAALAADWIFARPGEGGFSSGLSLATLSFVLLLWGLGAWFLGRCLMRTHRFCFALLICMVPLPPSWVAAIEYLLQHASSTTAYWLFQLSGLPVFRMGHLDFKLPGITLDVAPECSGIQSTVALFVVSLAAGHLLLRSPKSRVLLSLAVIPFGILRNAVRIVTIGELCVHIGPQMIDSYVHRKGGWIFFLVALIPFIFLAFLLARADRTAPSRHSSAEGLP